MSRAKICSEILYPIDSSVHQFTSNNLNNKSDPVRNALDRRYDSVKSFDYTTKIKLFPIIAV